jgi:hypothetical protein
MKGTILQEQVRVWIRVIPVSFSMTAVVITTKLIRIEQEVIEPP